ncbi:uncharacterized protein LAJ45_05371 [Morchella importuna]|uniref:uncharacterized protein n=1 Tax=Morchella importuna TaxID=1174673 RepID=UPI001E8D54E6|nr:uncharacterized protein LAJ45_05371 [Morchella importuna]KAH8150675.1 hypothetical protein LAJ45_05371 [Morchella importuna]
MSIQSARDMPSSSSQNPRMRPQLTIRVPPPPHLQNPMPPIPPQTIRVVPHTKANNKEPRCKDTKNNNAPLKNPRGIIDINNLTSNERIKAALEPLLARWSTNLSFREITAIARLPAEEAEAMFVVQLIDSLEAEKRRRRAAESCVKLLEETHTELLRKKKEVHEETQGLLRKRSMEIREEEEWVCMRERELGGENAALKERVRHLEIDLWNARKRDGSMI